MLSTSASSTSRIEEDFREFDRLAAWPIVFQKLRNESLFEAEEFSLRAAKSPLNRNLNRYRDVAPYDHSRVLLKEGETDYINASLVEGCALSTPRPTPGPAGDTRASPDLASPMEPARYRRYILTQGPLLSTACHFWQMVWEQNSLAIVMLNKVMEKGVTKCAQYWPIGEANDDHDSYLFEETGFRVTLLETEDEKYFVVRRLLLEYLPTGAEREVLHFHYTTWPDFGVPDSPSAFLHFLLAVRQSGGLNPELGPPIIHCSAGIGRSGTFCLVDSALIQIEAKKSFDVVEVQSLLMHMRRFRMGLIQTFDQLRFSYLAIIEGGRCILENRFTRETLQEDDKWDEEEDMVEEEESSEEEEDDDSSEDMVPSDGDDEEEEDVDDLPDIMPPTPPVRVESLSPASKKKTLPHTLVDSDDDDDDDLVPTQAPPPLPQKHNMGLNVNKIARPASTDTLSIDEGFVDVQTPVIDADASSTPTAGFANQNQLRKRIKTGQSSFDSSPEEALLVAGRSTRDSKDQLTDETSTWKWLFLPPVLIIGYFVYRYYYS